MALDPIGAHHFAGFAFAIVVDNNDPLNLGRVRVRIPGYHEDLHPEWSRPMGWPGGGMPVFQGARYPTRIGQQVAVFFEQGDVMAPTLYVPVSYGIDPESNAPLGPTQASTAEDPNELAVIWENFKQVLYAVNKWDDEDLAKRDQRIVIADKATGSNITLNSTDGDDKNSVTITIEGNTSVNIRANGIVDISGGRVQIQGRIVAEGGGDI